MDSKVLYTNDDAATQCVAVKPMELTMNTGSSASSRRAATTPGGASLSASRRATTLTTGGETVFLQPHESLYSYLYIGASDGTLLALRFHVFLTELTVPGGGGSTYEHRVALEAQSKVAITAPSAFSPKVSSSGSGGGAKPQTPSRRSAAATPVKAGAHATTAASLSTESLQGVHAIEAPLTLPFVFVLAHGRFQVHEDDTLQPVDGDYTAALLLANAAVLLMCAGHEQSAALQQHRPSAQSSLGGDTPRATSPTGMAGIFSNTPQQVYYALLLNDWTVVLVECARTGATRLAFAEATSSGGAQRERGGQELRRSASSPQIPRSQTDLRTALSVPPRTCTMAWSGNRLITGSPDAYCLYDTLHGTMLSRLDVSAQLRGCAPYTTYMPSAAIDPSRAGYSLAAEAAVVCADGTGTSESDSSSSSSSDSSDCAGDVSASDDDGIVREESSAAVHGWPAALVFRLRENQLYMCHDPHAVDLAAATPFTDLYGASNEVHCSPPFIISQHESSVAESGTGAASALPSLPPAASSRARASLVQLRRASRPLSPTTSGLPPTPPTMVIYSSATGRGRSWTSPTHDDPISFMSTTVLGVRVFPLGLIGVSRHMVEALLWKPFAVQLEDQIERGHFARTLCFVSQCFRGSDAAQAGVLRRVCQASGARAMSRHQYRVAFYFYTVAGGGVGALLRLFPELHRQLPSSASSALGTMRGESQEQVGTSGSVDRGSAAAWQPTTAAASTRTMTEYTTLNSRQLTYPSHAPYRALFRILLSWFFSLVVDGPATPADEHLAVDVRAAHENGGSPLKHSPSADQASPLEVPSAHLSTSADVRGASPAAASHDGRIVEEADQLVKQQAELTQPSSCFPSSPQAAPSLVITAAATDARGAVELALLCLFAMDMAGTRRLRTTEEELLRFMASVQTLHHTDECTAAVLAALGAPIPPLLLTLLTAITEGYDAALLRCEEDGDVMAAGRVLVMYAQSPDTTAEGHARLLQLHLPWMLDTDPLATVQLLTTSTSFPSSHPSPQVVLPILLSTGGTVLLDYLSWLLYTVGSEDPAAHQLYALQLVRTLQTLRDDVGLHSFSSPALGAADGAGSETGLVGHVRRALLSFLAGSPFYDKERVLAALIQAGLHDEQCIVLEALEDHIGVLSVLVFAAKDMGRAVRYCETHYAQECAHEQQQWHPFAGLLHAVPANKAAGATAVAHKAFAPDGRSGAASMKRADLEEWGSGPGSSASFCGPASPSPLSRATSGMFLPHDASNGSENPFLDSTSPATHLTAAVDAPLLPSNACRSAVAREAAALQHVAQHSSTFSSQDDVAAGISRGNGSDGHPQTCFNRYLHMLLHVLLVPPAGHSVAMDEMVWLLRTHSPAMSPRLVLASLPGDLPLSCVAPYLIRSFQQSELNDQLVLMESAAVQSALCDAVRRHVTLQQRCLWIDERRRCVVCGAPLEERGLVVVFPNLKAAHFRCHQDSTLDPERAVPFLSDLI